MSEPIFGFTCGGEFSIARTANGFIIPGSKNAPLDPSMVGWANAGSYILEVKYEGNPIINEPVFLHIVTHRSEPKSFFAIEPKQDLDVFEKTLRSCVGKKIDLAFSERQ